MGMATDRSILAWEIPQAEELDCHGPWVVKSQTNYLTTAT